MRFHFAAIHILSPRLVQPQLSLLSRFCGRPFTWWAYLDDFDGWKNLGGKDRRIDRSGISGWGTHGAKLNKLTRWVLSEADNDDVLAVMDGDSFLIHDLSKYLGERGWFKKYPLFAVRRDECGDRFPHPSFCVARVGFWRDFNPDWTPSQFGDIPVAERREYLGCFDGDDRFPESVRMSNLWNPGSKLWFKLRKNGIRWHPMLRCNRVNLHPIFHGVYDRLVYHMGAGFRIMLSDADTEAANVLRLPVEFFSTRNVEMANRMMDGMWEGRDFWRGLV